MRLVTEKQKGMTITIQLLVFNFLVTVKMAKKSEKN
jgi:hypothetical protein